MIVTINILHYLFLGYIIGQDIINGCRNSQLLIYIFSYLLIYILLYFLEKISLKNQEILIFHTLIVCVRVCFGIGIFCFGLDRKIPKIPKSRGSGFENPEKSQVKNPENPEIPGIGIGIFYLRDIPGIFYLRDFFSLDWISRQKANSGLSHRRNFENPSKLTDMGNKSIKNLNVGNP